MTRDGRIPPDGGDETGHLQRERLTISQALEILRRIEKLDISTTHSPQEFLRVFDRASEALTIAVGNILAKTGKWQNTHSIMSERRNNERLIDRMAFQFAPNGEPILTNMSITSGQRSRMDRLPPFVLEYSDFSSQSQTETGFTKLVMINNGVSIFFPQSFLTQQPDELALINTLSSGIQRATNIVLKDYDAPGSTLGETQDFPQPQGRR